VSESQLYQRVVLDHYRNPRNHGALALCTHAADGVNPLCGDALRFEVRCVDGRIVEIGFSGEACAITTATASMLSSIACGLDAGDLAAFALRFERLIEGASDLEVLPGGLDALGELRRYPARRKCALLPWATLRAALADIPATTTEQEIA
jgi:nitrogen fixation NifU-like protein